MKEIDKQEAPGVAGGYRDGCIPGPLGPLPIVPLPGEGLEPYPREPLTPYCDAPERFVTDPPAV